MPRPLLLIAPPAALAAALLLLAALGLAGPGAAQEVREEAAQEARIASLQEAQVPLQEAAAVRQENFRALNRNLRSLFAMTKSGNYDQGEAARLLRALAERAEAIPQGFATGTESLPDSEAKPALWDEGGADFIAKAYALADAAATGANDASSGALLGEALQPLVADLAGQCTACHRPYRTKH